MKTLFCITVVLTAGPSEAAAFEPEHLLKQQETNGCLKCDLSGANFCKANLAYANLWEADFRGRICRRQIYPVRP